MTNLIQRIINKKHDIVGIRVNGIFYYVDYIAVDDQVCYDEFCHDDLIIKAYLCENDEFIEYDFNVGQLLESNVKLYKLQEV